MSYFRSYFEKNNTILKNSQVNTAKNPTTEIFYGSSFSKFLFKIDLTDLKNKVDNGDLVIDTNTKHYLRLTNTIFGDETYLGAERGTGRQRTNSFDLILFKIDEFWDEGLGFDYEDEVYDFTVGNKTFDERPSNWYNRTTLNEWTIHGVYDTDPIVLSGSTHTDGLIHFDNGNENINLDITDYVNGIIVSGDTNHGLGLAFSLPYQDIEPEIDQSVAFFTKYTQTFFEPYVESIFQDRIIDNRHNFIDGIQQNLYLYVTKGTNYYNLDTLPSVDILDSSNNILSGLSGLTVTQVKKGIYQVSFALGGLICDGKKFYYDTWKNLQIDGQSIPDVTQKFIPKQYTSNFTIGSNPTDYNKYSIQFYGIKQNEKIKRGELRKVVINFRSINDPKNQLFEEVLYRMFIKEGKTDVIVHDWTLLDVTNENSFTIDTSIYVPREYWVEVKAKIHSEEIFYDEYIKFEILSEK